MLLRIAEFKENESTPVQADYDAKKLDVEFVDMKYSDPVHMRGMVERDPKSIHFHGQLTARIEHICGRCLRTVPETIDRPFQMYYEIEGKDVIDTTDDLREVLILDHPMSYICRENCNGLCPSCGTNLNEESCRCSQPRSKNLFSALKKSWDSAQKEKRHGKS